jgi:hypothetical protein
VRLVPHRICFIASILFIISLEHPASARAILPPQNISPDRIDSLSKITDSESAGRISHER